VVAIGLTQTTAAQGLIAAALHGGQAGKCAVLNYTLPIWVMILSYLFLKVRPKLGQWIATGVALLGIVTMAFVGSQPGSLEPVLFALGASFCWGVGVVLTQSLLRRHPGIDTIVLTTWQMIVGAAVLGVVALLMPEPIHWTTGFVLSLLYNIGPATAVAFLLWFTLQRRIDANVLSLIVLIVPLVGVAAGSIQLGERPSVPDTVGMLLILAAIALMVLSQRRKAAVAAVAVPAGD
jgi:drug/metabolite transporter (DMT)-like permease